MTLHLQKKFLSISFFSLLGLLSANAQVLQKAVQKIRSHQNISYTDVVGSKFHFQDDFFSDTVTSNLLLVPKEPNHGGYFRVKNRDRSYAFDGNKLVNLNLTDSTYKIEKSNDGGQYARTLLYWAKDIEKLLKSHPKKIKQLQDTIIDGNAYANIQITVADTLIDSKHKYEATNFVNDKRSNLPKYIIRQLKGNADDGTYFKFTETHSYSNYVFDSKNFPDLSVATIPANFKEPAKRVPVVYLPKGTPAPLIKAVDLSGKAFDLAKLKGKLVLINFSLLGCPHCVGAAQMLNRLQEKYQEKGLVIVNIYPVDQKEAIAKFDRTENVKTQSCTSERAVQQAYPFDGYPSFYLLDQKGLVAQSYNGYYKSLESEIVEKIESMEKL